MMKKKSMAVAMAAVTVATTVAPAFANTLEGTIVSANDTQKLDALKSEIKGYLDVKYATDATLLKDADKAGDAVYTVKANKNANATTIITEMKELDRLLANLEPNDYINISVVDNGSNKIDGNVVDYKVENYKENEIADVETAANLLKRDSLNTENPVISVDKVNENTVSIELANNETPLVVKTGDAKLDLRADGVIYKQNELGMFLDKEGKVTTTKADYVVEGFKTKKLDLEAKAGKDDKEFDYDKTAKEFAIRAGEVSETELNVADLFETKVDRFTSNGLKLVKYIEKYNATADTKKKITATIADDKLSLIINVPVKKEEMQTRSLVAGESVATITVKGTANEVATFAKRLDAAVNVMAGAGEAASITTLAGKNRQETAIEVSKAMKTTKNVVLVSDYAIADGLAATPFAKKNNAAILLTSKDSISKDVMDEIKVITGRATKGNANEGNVYLIGGDAVLSKNLETQLYNAGIEDNKIERIKGKNREETSLKIAEKMTGNTEVFVTGGRAEADAMSIANIAAQKEAPILLASQNDGLSEAQVKYIESNKIDTTAAYVVGGEAKVPVAVETQVKDALDANDTVERLKGKGRQETNAAVINKFVSSLQNVYVAKSDDKGLVDALAAGVLAGEEKTAVVLATDEVSELQKTVLENKGKEVDLTKTQIGHGIAAKVWESINAILNK